ncbi:uncharacterized protein Z519_08266 [Cladophialophora bantiana CBS 173.52]|uniref:Vacuolar membrane PQ loop repeat protein n=1 Tax=Cladophialophora bantiana (strain ATCC 10958 / CBS 173.52 / CDC B-1940 / NIH 8579) TaxID=1442370 RepID=A0A0D2HKT1_CLAB1|nr:uncharacterized protein Z519_08266 [Cladophialophora bantiana CBS 173.52]KIW91370.1 hypothetical protein Z519_08266 [Cladophialophora bantiana CBS 173.52]
MASFFGTFSSSSPYHPNNSDLPLTIREAFSGIFGSISLACWIFLLVPQLIENYRNGSAEAISLLFIFVWFLGDIANLAGALWAGLVPVVVAIGVYFCIADGVLIGQCLYYGIMNKRREGRVLLRRSSLRASASSSTGGGGGGVRSTTADGEASGPPAPSGERPRQGSSEEEPLLKRTRTNSMTIPGSMERRRSSVSLRRRRSSFAAHHQDQLAKILEESDEPGTRLWFRNAMSVLAIGVVGAAGWALAYESGAWKPSPTSDGSGSEEMAPGAQILGYLSAVAYLGARIPQIIKNARDRSCEGLSLLFFILSLMGNATYGAGILCHSTEHKYVVKNLPWLIGSLGTMIEDITIFIQFHMYKVQEEDNLGPPEHAVV